MRYADQSKPGPRQAERRTKKYSGVQLLSSGGFYPAASNETPNSNHQDTENVQIPKPKRTKASVGIVVWLLVIDDCPECLRDGVHRFSDKDANAIDPVKQGLSPEIPREMRVEVSLQELGKDKTEVKVIEYGWPVGPMMEMSKTGLEQCLDKMAALFGK